MFGKSDCLKCQVEFVFSGERVAYPSGNRNQAVDLVKVELDSNSEFGYSFVPTN